MTMIMRLSRILMFVRACCRRGGCGGGGHDSSSDSKHAVVAAAVVAVLRRFPVWGRHVAAARHSLGFSFKSRTHCARSDRNPQRDVMGGGSCKQLQ